MHDAYRVNKGGKGPFDQVMRGLDVLKRHEVDWNVLTTIHAANGDHGREVYRFLRDESGRHVHPVHPHHRAGVAEQTLPIADAGWGHGVTTGRCTRRTGTWSPAARWPPSSTAGS